MGKTFAEKLFSQKAGCEVSAGAIVTAAPDYVMSHDNAAAISGTFKKMGALKVKHPERVVVILDHEIPAPKESSAVNHAVIRKFAKEQGIIHFYDINHGVCHQVFAEQGFALPGKLVVGSDSHTTACGALGAFGAGIGRSEAAAVWAVGDLWFQVPETIQIVLVNGFQKGVTAKDAALYIIGQIGADGADYNSVEFTGPALPFLPVADRMTLANMAAEMGAKNGYFPPDEMTFQYLEGRAKAEYQPLYSDPDARFRRFVEVDLAAIEPGVAKPHTVDHYAPIREVEGVPIDQAFIGACTNGRLEDLAQAAQILGNRRVKTRTLIIPASWTVYREAMRLGYIETFIDAGAVVMNPGCGPCLGAHAGVLAPGETAFSTSNRNFKGRMGCRDAHIYLGSPLSVAASAVTGAITDPRRFL